MNDQGSETAAGADRRDFQTVLSLAIADAEVEIVPVTGREHDTLAAAVLMSCEMQAIRTALLHAAFNAAIHAYPAAGVNPTRTYLRDNCRVPESVIEWVLS